MSFVRAHSPEQREVRRSAILDTARAMLGEMPVGDVTLNGLSRQACMAKSNVLRYFESREAVLLELATEAMTDWVDELEGSEPGLDGSAPISERIDRLLDVLTSSLVARPVLCDLITAQASSLEHNVSAATVLAFKRAAVANALRLAAVVSRRLPELDADDAMRFTAIASMLLSSMWIHAHPPQAVLEAYAADESLRPYRIEFAPALRDALEVVLAGILTPSSRRSHVD